ncbi:MAG: ABC transporter ATP-binding protein [Chloroflexota bacterium]|nr:ABC transporter ATP-binding protein [Chloroflexota bacterium]
MLELDNVSKVYQVGTFGGKELRAVNNVSFEVDKGEIISLIGESGSGKSTIGKMVLRLIPISSGAIIFNGTDITTLKGRELKEYYRNVQGVFQDPFSSFNPIFKADRVYKIVRDEFFPHVSGPEWNDRVNHALESVGLNPRQVLNKFPHQLSGGQLQRLLIARALLLDVEFLVADEIISMLDASTRIDVLNLLADLRSRGLSILFITHDLSLGYYISQKSVILHRGVVVEMGSTVKIYANPLHPYTRMLMASVPRLDKRWQEVEQEVELEALDLALPAGYAFYESGLALDTNGDSAVASPTLVEVESDHFVACVRS